MECPFEQCRINLKPWNAAINFSTAVLSVKRAVDLQILHANQSILEVGAGSLRNGLYVLRTLGNIKYYVLEMPETTRRFQSNYQDFERLGGHLIRPGFVKREFEVAICTFVLETICPWSKRLDAIASISEAIKRDGVLIASFRGYPGVKGTNYKTCQAGEGFITPKMTFVKPMSIMEVRQLLKEGGFSDFNMLQRYRVDSPQNIHIVARIL